ncbi:hypothetical protein [Sinorhizobium fredii]|uniref:hypothetical protein n=1 Tax=Rhizobium fredii TaxID=380 RepID=UPI0004B9F89D|nr:hypothetical protein [Sinorhizobium fredii]
MDLDAMGCEEAQGIEEKPEAGAAFRRERFPKGLGGGAGGVSSLIAAPATRTTSRRHEARIIPVVPHKANKKQKPGFFAKALYRGRARIEQAVGELKRFKRVALRCEKDEAKFRIHCALTAGFILVRIRPHRQFTEVVGTFDHFMAFPGS